MAKKQSKENMLKVKINGQIEHLKKQFELAVETENKIKEKRLRIEGAISILNRILNDK